MRWPFLTRAFHEEVLAAHDLGQQHGERALHAAEVARLLRERDDAQQKYDTLVHETLAMVKDGFHAPKPAVAPVKPDPLFSDRVMFAIEERAGGDRGWKRQLQSHAAVQQSNGLTEDDLIADIRDGGTTDD